MARFFEEWFLALQLSGSHPNRIGRRLSRRRSALRK